MRNYVKLERIVKSEQYADANTDKDLEVFNYVQGNFTGNDSEPNEPDLILKLYRVLSDEYQSSYNMSDAMFMRFYRLLIEYIRKCRYLYSYYLTGKPRLEKLMESEVSVVYYVQAANGRRIATVNEVKNGVKELEPEFQDCFGEEERQYIYTLLWTFTGLIRFYTKTGLSVSYTNDTINENDVQLIIKAGQKLRGMIDFFSGPGDFPDIEDKLKKFRKMSAYKYPTFAEDEIVSNISFKQDYFVCREELSKAGAVTDAQREARRLIFIHDNYKYKFLPHDMAVIRQVAYELRNSVVSAKVVRGKTRELPHDVVDLISKLDKGRESGAFRPKSDFVFKVMDTVRKYGKCSPKQLAILQEAVDKMDIFVFNTVKAKKDKEDKDSKAEFNDSIFSMAQALGNGTLAAEDEIIGLSGLSANDIFGE